MSQQAVYYLLRLEIKRRAPIVLGHVRSVAQRIARVAERMEPRTDWARLSVLVSTLVVLGALAWIVTGCSQNQPTAIAKPQPPVLELPIPPAPCGDELGDDDCPNAWEPGDVRWSKWLGEQRSLALMRLLARKRFLSASDRPHKGGGPPPRIVPREGCPYPSAPVCAVVYRQGYNTVTRCADACTVFYLVEFESADGSGCVIHTRVDPPGIPSEPIEVCD